MKTTLEFKDMQIFGKESDPKEAIIDWDFDIDLIVGSKSNIEFQYGINKMSYYIHPNLPNHKIYTDSINKIPARKNIDKSKYILINKGK